MEHEATVNVGAGIINVVTGVAFGAFDESGRYIAQIFARLDWRSRSLSGSMNATWE